MVWLALVFLACVAVATSWHRDPRPALAFLFGLFAIRLAGYVVPVPYYHMAGAALWGGIGGMIIQKYNHPLCGALIILGALCYLVARVTGAPVALGSWPFILSDAFGVLALVVAGGWHHGHRRIGFLGRFHRVYTRRNLSGGAGMVGRTWKGW